MVFKRNDNKAWFLTFANVEGMHCRMSCGIYPSARKVDFENGFSSTPLSISTRTNPRHNQPY
jgi:hypothetical protein